MSYAALTREDPSAAKRWLQARRMDKALSLVPRDASRVVDYGAGDADAAARLAERRPGVEVIAFEPTPELLEEARVRTAGVSGVRLVQAEEEMPSGWADVALCLEVFEHLPDAETRAAVAVLERVLRPGGVLIVGVPLEIGPVALVKGGFRIARRPREFDARWKGIVAAAMGAPPGDRPIREIAPGRPYHPHHLGFDHRRFERMLKERFDVAARTGSPFGRALGPLNMELYITGRKRGADG